MNLYLRLVVVLGMVSALAAGALALTYHTTKPAIQREQEQAKIRALEEIFFSLGDRFASAKKVPLADGESIAITLPDATEPEYFAAEGAGIGYNKSSPIVLLVGFRRDPTSPAAHPIFTVVHWKVLASEETPGLGEKAKDQEPPYTFWDLLTGKGTQASKDRRTAFQRQFEGKRPSEMKAKETIDIITASTYSTVGIIQAIQNAEANLRAALSASSSPKAP